MRKVETCEPVRARCTSSTALVLKGDLRTGAAKFASRATPLLKSCDFRAGAAKVYFVHFKVATFAPGLPESTLQLHVCLKIASTLERGKPKTILCMLHLYFKVATFEPELPKRTSRTTLVFQNCHFRARAATVFFAHYT